MTDKRPTPDQTAGKSRRKRAAPTIDLTATEVPAQAAKVDADPPPQAAAADEPAAQAASAPEQTAGPRPASVPPFAAKADAPREDPAPPLLPMVAAGVAGAAAMCAVLVVFWLAGFTPNGDSGNPRIAGLETQLQELQKRPAPALDTGTVNALALRVAKMEETLTRLPAGDPALAERVTAADNAMKSLGVALAALNRRNDELAANSTQARERAEAAEKAVAGLRASLQDVSKTASAGASSADLAPLQLRIASLEQSAKAASAEIAKIAAAASAPDTAARLALSAASLRDAALRGAPFTAELAQAKALGADDKALAPLLPFAAAGLPSEKALAAELSALLPGLIKSAGAPQASATFIERLQANAGQLVRIRPVDAPAGDDPSTVLARLEVDAAKADIAAALTDLGKLSDAQRAPAQGWIAKAKAREAAAVAARQFAADTARALGAK